MSSHHDDQVPKRRLLVADQTELQQACTLHVKKTQQHLLLLKKQQMAEECVPLGSVHFIYTWFTIASMHLTLLLLNRLAADVTDLNTAASSCPASGCSGNE